MTETNQGGSPTTSLVPRGVTVTGLASVNWRTGDGNPLGQIQHAHDDWYANTVRLQVGVPLLRGKSNATPAWHGGGPTAALAGYLATAGNAMTAELNGCHYNADFLGYLDQAVGLAQQLGLTVVLCAQHEGLDNTAMPDGNDIAFWKVLYDHYGSGVICDLFNEPEPGAVYSDAWLGWQGGGPGSDGVNYTGFETAVSELRQYGLSGTFWVEGIQHSGTLQGIAGDAGNFQLSDPLDNLVYAIHHPVGARNAANWTTQFGYLAELGIPVVVGEWTNWATKNAECWPDAASTVPEFLSFVSGLGGCGLIVWALLPRVLVVDQKEWAPTQILASYKCDGSVTGQGAGQLIQAQFAAWAGQPQPGATLQG